eukprot:jgi/Botrbrau1/14214/Bobra.0254s0004.1
MPLIWALAILTTACGPADHPVTSHSGFTILSIFHVMPHRFTRARQNPSPIRVHDKLNMNSSRNVGLPDLTFRCGGKHIDYSGSGPHFHLVPYIYNTWGGMVCEYDRLES